MDAVAVFGLISADGERLKGRAPLTSQLTLVGLDFWDWDLVILLPKGVGRRERRFCPLALSDFLFKTLLGTVNRLKDSIEQYFDVVLFRMLYKVVLTARDYICG